MVLVVVEGFVIDTLVPALCISNAHKTMFAEPVPAQVTPAKPIAFFVFGSGTTTDAKLPAFTVTFFDCDSVEKFTLPIR